jgi:drug/metabolite transporter (DMT)-like permease
MKLTLFSAPGACAALAAALLFGAGTPLAKLLLQHTGPWLMAALLYLGSGLGLWLLRRYRHAPPGCLKPGEWRWLLGAIVCGGVIAPVLLMVGLTSMAASSAALLLNAEGVFTALIAWFAFKENFDSRIALGMAAIVLGAVVLAWPTGNALQLQGLWPALALLGACLGWAIDNNLTRKVALSDASWIAMVKGLCAGTTNLVLALLLGAHWPGMPTVLGAAVIGFLSYGASLVLFVLALRHLGTARTGANFSVAPFFGAVLALVLLNEPGSWTLLFSGLLMAVGVALHLTEHHQHEHLHAPMAHTHEHLHSAEEPHHVHDHAEPPVAGVAHTHAHQHTQMTHTHAHFPDAHHQHRH